MRPKLARAVGSIPCRKVPQEDRNRKRDRGAAQGSLLLASPQQEVSFSRNIQQGWMVTP
jgi:hypothetical protein